MMNLPPPFRIKSCDVREYSSLLAFNCSSLSGSIHQLFPTLGLCAVALRVPAYGVIHWSAFHTIRSLHCLVAHLNYARYHAWEMTCYYCFPYERQCGMVAVLFLEPMPGVLHRHL